ncbi:ATP-binding cassette domain-containing protein [Arsenicitalea aurantiaca]|uniref:ATP-binding cassette domain-containing protein n=1 Tax=Arsenicitalea aurantiaca TaxID=1783274 RepID=A0A433X4A5_9HYPH|nr:ATP-binding cassette domain-containing protein [Arsenicitalea aurantiaca]RUT28899.1 ATP-binding cassette domain-containing protein [Arsenicitalea aurantiaca]
MDAVIAPGQILTVMGPSGAGKSSLIAAIAGLTPEAMKVGGRVVLEGRDLTGHPPQMRRIGVLFQDALLFPHFSVGQNLGLALPAGLSRAERRARIDEALESVGLAGRERADPTILSGGERARVALMRTLLAEPRALLLDEPFSRLDAPLRRSVREAVFHHAKARRLPVLLVTHDRADAEAAGGPVHQLGSAPDF